MIASWWAGIDVSGIIGWTLSIGGITGLIAAAIFAPGIFAFFINTKIGRVLLGIGAVLLLLFGARESGYNTMKRECERLAKERAIQIMQKDIQIGELASKLDQQVLDESKKQEQINEAVQAKLKEELSKLPDDDVCRAKQLDIDRLYGHKPR